MNTVKGYAQHEEAVFTQGRAGARRAAAARCSRRIPSRWRTRTRRCRARCGRLMVQCRGVSAAQGRSGIPAAAGRADGHGESHRGLAQRLQPGGERVQRVHPPIPGGDHGEGDGREAAKVFHGDGRGAAGPPTVDFSKPPATPATPSSEQPIAERPATAVRTVRSLAALGMTSWAQDDACR